MDLDMLRAVLNPANPAVKMREQVELAVDDLQAIETFLNAIDHFVDELSLRDNIAGRRHEPHVQQLIHHAQTLVGYAQQRLGRARHRLERVPAR